MGFGDVVKGLSVTARHLLRRPVTYQYPENPKPVAPRYHGRHVLNRYADGLEKCIGCELCAWACPADAIFVQGAANTPEARFSPGERYASDYQINYMRCIFCGLCIEACPTRALTMSNTYEMSSDSREEMIWGKDKLLAPPADGAAGTPQNDGVVAARGATYYGGYAATPPLTSEDAAHRSERATGGHLGSAPMFDGEGPLEQALEDPQRPPPAGGH